MTALWLILKGLPWKLILIGAALAALIVLGWRANVWHEAYKALPKTQAALKLELECGKDSQCAKKVTETEARNTAIQQANKATYDQEIADLRNRPVPKPRVIRVCKSTDASGLPLAGAAEGSAPTETGGVLLGFSELDTAPLRRAAAEADEINAAYRFLTNRDTALATPPK